MSPILVVVVSTTSFSTCGEMSASLRPGRSVSAPDVSASFTLTVVLSSSSILIFGDSSVTESPSMSPG